MLSLGLGINRSQFSAVEVSVDLADVTLTDTITDGAITYNFDADVQIVHDALGFPHVVQDGARTITSITPASADVSSNWIRGAEQDTYFDQATVGNGAQGFDENLETNGSIKATMRVTYDASLNIDPGETGSAIALDSTKSILKHLPDTYTDAGITDQWGVLTVLSEIPVEDFFRPSPSATSKVVTHSASDLDLTALRNLATISGQTAVTAVDALLPDVDFRAGRGGENLRALSNTKAGTGSTYMSTIGTAYNGALLALHTSASDVDKRTAALKLCQAGIDRAGEYDRGWRGASGAGQFQCYLESMFFAAFLLKDAGLLAKAQGSTQNIVQQMRFVQTANVGFAPGWPTGGVLDQRRFNRSFKTVHDGQPWLFQQNEVADVTSTMDQTQRYLGTSAPSAVMGLLAILLLQDGPGGISGADAWLQATGGGIVGNGAKDATNPRMAAVWFMDRYFNIRPNLITSQIPAWAYDFYDAYRSEIDIPVYAGPGVALDLSAPSDTSTYLTATADGFSYDFTGVTLDTSAVTTRQVRYSTDKIDWEVIADATDTGTVTGLVAGVPYYVQERRLNADGYWSDWSSNHSYTDSPSFTGERMVVTPSGATSAAAPTFVSTPTLYIPDAPSTTEDSYTAAGAALGANDVLLTAGAALVTGYPAPTRTYQAIVNGVAVGSPQSDPRILLDRNATVDVKIEITLTNASGSVSAQTSASTIPAVPTPDVDTMFSSDFGGSYERFWPDVYDTMVAGGGALLWDPFQTNLFVPPVENEGSGFVPETTSAGAIGVDKSGSFPNIRINLAATKPLTIGEHYLLEVEMPIATEVAQAATSQIKVGSSSGADDYYLASLDQYPQPKVEKLALEFTATSADLWLELAVITATGGTSGGDPKFSSLTLTRIPSLAGESSFPEPLASPFTVFDSAVSGFDVADWTTGGDVTDNGSSLIFGNGSGWPDARRVFDLDVTLPDGEDQAVIGRECRVTVDFTEVAGASVMSRSFGRDTYEDPNYGTVPAANSLYVDDQREGSTVQTVDTFRLQTAENLRIYFQNRAPGNSPEWRVDSLKIELL